MCQFSLWYLDDGNLIVNKTQLIDVIKVLQSNEATEKGLFLNLSKCFIYSPKLPVWASSVKYFDPETEMEKTVPSGNSGTVVLGTPIGSQEFIDDFILQEILIPLEKLLENIKLLKDSHTEFFLFRNCATFCKIAFLLRTLPPAQGDFLMKGYESRMKDFLKHLVKIQHDLPELAWFQASLQFRLGGLGLKVAKQHHEAAFAASLIQCKFWLDQVCSQQVNNEVNSLIMKFTSSLRSQFPQDFPTEEDIRGACKTQQPLQKSFSSCIDKCLLALTLSNPDLPAREKARLRSVSSDNAARWLSAAPNSRSFKYFEDNQFSAVLRHWLGIPLFNRDCRCRCGETIDCFGDHAITCKSGGGPIHRHDLIRDALFDMCNSAGISVSKELSGYEAGKKDRVGDIVLHSFDQGREKLIDVTCWSPLYSPRIQHSADSAQYTVNEAHSFKIKSRKANSEGKIQTTKGMLAFMPFACSALGTLSLEAKSLLNAIASEMSLKHNSPRSLCLSRVVTRISTPIQQGNAFCLVNKMIDLKIYYSSNLQY